MLSNKEILDMALRQSAYDVSCSPEDFLKEENVVLVARDNEKARKYYDMPHIANMIYYGRNIVAAVREDLVSLYQEYMNTKGPKYYLFETPRFLVLNEKLKEYGLGICFMAEYFLPDVTVLERKDCPYELKVLTQPDFTDLYKPEWRNALCEKRKELDVLGVGAYEDGKLIGLAGCSMDCDDMWQIGIDVLPEYRKNKIASALVSNLAMEILERDKVPFYCAAWSNIASVRTAVASGFRPAWIELSAKSLEFVEGVLKD